MTTNKIQEFFDALEQLKREADQMFIAEDAIDAWYNAETVICLLHRVEDIARDFQKYCDDCINATNPDDNL